MCIHVHVILRTSELLVKLRASELPVTLITCPTHILHHCKCPTYSIGECTVRFSSVTIVCQCYVQEKFLT